MEVEPIEVSVEVPLAPWEAFRLFGPGLNRWWPREYTWSRDALVTIAIEPRQGGRCFERGPHAFEVQWGRVLAWEPPQRLAFSWQIGADRVPVPDPELASEVEVTLAGGGSAATRVTVIHTGFERHGEAGREYRDALAAEQGWPYILGRYAEAAEAHGRPRGDR